MSEIEEGKKIKKEDISDGEKFLYQLSKTLYKFNTSKLDREVVDKLGEYSQKILEKRRKARGYQPTQPTSKQEQSQDKQGRIIRGPSEIIEEYDESMEVSVPRLNAPIKSGKMKPSLLKNLNMVFTSTFLTQV